MTARGKLVLYKKSGYEEVEIASFDSAKEAYVWAALNGIMNSNNAIKSIKTGEYPAPRYESVKYPETNKYRFSKE